MSNAIGDDDRVLNDLQKTVAQWIQKIKELALLDRDPRLTCAGDEQAFWLAIASAVHHIHEQLESSCMKLTLGVLQERRRMFIVTGFKEESGFNSLQAKTTGLSNLE